MPSLRPLIARTALLLVALAIPVYPCGGPDHYDIDAPLATADQFLQAVEIVDDFDYRLRAELRFLYPFVLTRAPQASALWDHAYGMWGADVPAQVDTSRHFSLAAEEAAFAAAGVSGDVRRVERTARALVDAAFAVPAIVADEWQPSVRRAVEALEVTAAPQLASDLSPALVQRLYGAARGGEVPTSSPPLPAWAQSLLVLRALPRDSVPAWGDANAHSLREGSVAFVALQLSMKRGIPDGWAQEVRDSVPSERWRAFAAMHDDWDRRFSHHPLGPWVAASRIRLAYFAGDTTAAWNAALALYAAHRARALEEMRYLLRQGFDPPSLDDRRIDDVLRTALMGEVTIDGDRWRMEWERAARPNAAWAVAMRDRLMWHAARDSTDALRIPLQALAVPAPSLSPIGRSLRLVALIRRGRTAEAIAQADSLGDDPAVAPMKVQLLLAGRRWRDALAAPGVSPEARQYLVRVLAPDSVLAALVANGARPLALEARKTLAIRAASAGRWSAAAGMLGGEAGGRAARWRRIQSLAADSSLSGRLAFARAMRARNGQLLWGNDKTWYRSLNWRLQALDDTTRASFNPLLPWSAGAERAAIGRHFRDGFEMYHAVRAYADFLARAPRTDIRRRAALREADATYNWLVNWDNNNSSFWSVALESEGIGRTIRQAGRP
ncbi:MAG: hypothetical protein IT359_11625 [Gemmatimonadaceae bacterium]|nr:hypothetical protein [Gemmatimonadaceae bacterium]